jgi:homocysteine S-methyltransferase
MAPSPFDPDRLSWPFAVLDGGLSTALEAAGHDLRDELWTARLLIEAADALEAAHRAFAAAGAEIVISASYQASVAGLVGAGASPSQARAAITESTMLARRGAPAAMVAASIGPYGAVLGDGSEYVGRYDLSRRALSDFHRERCALILQGEPDLVAIETMPSVDEIEIVLEVFADLPPVPAWVTITGGDGATTWAGDPAERVGELVSEHPAVVAVGVNCVAPRLVTPMLERLAASCGGRALVAYPNRGRAWDGAQHCWVGDTPVGYLELGDLESQIAEWCALGARLIGGCCGYGPDMVAHLRRIRDGHTDRVTG